MADNEPVGADALLMNGAPKVGSVDTSEQHDLLPKLIPYFDRHLIFPLLEFLSNQEDEESPAITKSKYELLRHTNMMDYVASLWQKLNDTDTVPAEFTKRRDEVLQRLEVFQQETERLDEVISDAEVQSNLRADKVANQKFLEQSYGITVETIETAYNYGRFKYSCGDYGGAADWLDRYTILSTETEKVNQAQWGKLACGILTTDWEAVMKDVTNIKDLIDTRLFNNPLAQLQHRTWLIHWCLFPFFNYEGARETLTELFFSPSFINTIQTNCPWILRYLTAAVITNRNRNKNMGAYQKQLKDMVRIVRQEGYEYSDPITDFVRALYVDFDFEEAQKKLAEADATMQADFFLVSAREGFVEAARYLISESYCKIHQRIDINDLSDRLGLSREEGEKWIVNLIRESRAGVDAKINYKENTVIMNHPPPSVYQQVIERTKGGFFRTQVLNSAVAK